MTKMRVGALALAGVVALLCGCAGGGGGGGSGGLTSPASPAAPPPPPPPPPPPAAPSSNANDDLFPALLTERFTNDAATGAASFSASTGGLNSASAAQSSLTFDYDSATNSYTVSNGNRSQRFTPTHVDAAQSNSAITAYVLTNGSVSDSLVLTKPGDFGALTYRYVGAAIWQRTTSAATIDAALDAIAYGVETPDGATPRTGMARYDVDLIGVGASTFGPFGVAGTGALRADFAAGALTASGTLQETHAQTGATRDPTNWSFSAALGSANTFAGTMQYHTSTVTFGAGDPRNGHPIFGDISGRFYGPAAEELGAAFSVSGTDFVGPRSVAGVIMGRKSSLPLPNLSLTPLYFDQTFTTISRAVTLERPHDHTQLSPSQVLPGPQQLSLEYRVSDQQYTVLLGNGMPGVVFPATQLVAAESNNRYSVYAHVNGDISERLVLYRPGASNDQLALTYVSFGSYVRNDSPLPSSSMDRTNFNWFAYGVPTSSGNLPTSGHGVFNGIIRGTRATTNSATPIVDIEGPINLDFDFGALTFSGAMQPFSADSAHQDFGSYTVRGAVGGFIPGATGTTFVGDIYSGVTLNEANGLQGQFYGPGATEVGGTFQINHGTGYMVGAFVANR